MYDLVVESPIVLALICGLVAALVVSPGYMSARIHGLAIAAPMPAKFPLRSFARSALIAFVLLINTATLALAHRVPVGTDLIAAGFLMLLFIPAEEHDGGASA
jgi:hypothetical protein